MLDRSVSPFEEAKTKEGEEEGAGGTHEGKGTTENKHRGKGR